jgi:hypothetical protein
MVHDNGQADETSPDPIRSDPIRYDDQNRVSIELEVATIKSRTLHNLREESG